MKSLSLSKPHLIITVGLPGSGKTFFAEKFAETFNAPYVSLEKTIPLAANKDAAVELCNNHLDQLLKTKQSVILEGNADTRAERVELAQKARAAGYDTLLVWVQTDPVTAKARAVKVNKNNPAKNLTPADYEAQVKRFAAPNAAEKPVVISGKHTYASQAKTVLKKLSGPRAAISTHTTTPVRTEQPGRRNITIR